MANDWRREAWIVHTTVCKERVGTEGDVRFCALALAGEVGELCNLIKKQWRAEWGHPPDDPARLRGFAMRSLVAMRCGRLQLFQILTSRP